MAEFTSATGLKPYIEALGGENSLQSVEFLTRYKQELRKAYPPIQSEGLKKKNFQC